MKKVYIVGAEVHICDSEELDSDIHTFKVRAVSSHPIYPAGTVLTLPRAGTASFDIGDDQVEAVQAKVDAWKGVAKTDKKPAPKKAAKGNDGVTKIGGNKK